MKVPNFQGLDVYNKADGHGTIERVFVGGGIVFSVKFDNGISRKFRIPRAFISGLLTTKDNRLQDFVDTLPDIETHPNDDIPSARSLNIVLSNKCALNSYRLALFGALDDFYQLYIDVYNLAIQHMVEYTAKELERTHQKPNGQLYFSFPKSVKLQVMKLFEPVLNRHLYIFTNEYHEIFAHSYAFHHFNFFPLNDGLSHRRLTFREFYPSIEDIYIDIFYKWKGEISRESIAKSVNERIQILAYLKAQEITVSPSQTSLYTDTNHPLYLIASLSSTACYRENHPVEPKSYVASLVSGNGQILLPAHYCPTCNRYFIGSKTLNEYEKQFGKFLIIKRLYQNSSSGFDSFSNFNAESLLHQYGYTVKADVLSDVERQKLLVSLMEKKQLTYHEICRTIEQNIKLFQGSPKYTHAVSKWMQDLKFVGDYIKSTF